MDAAIERPRQRAYGATPHSSLCSTVRSRSGYDIRALAKESTVTFGMWHLAFGIRSAADWVK